MIDFDKLLKVVVEQGASDLFITAGLPPSIKVSGKWPLQRPATCVLRRFTQIMRTRRWIALFA
jgi:Tfp pilus assembly ATPase PilU